MSKNQTPEQQARNDIDRKLNESGWIVQAKNKINWSASKGIAVKEYLTDVGPADYVVFVDKKPVGIVEAKRDEEGHRLTAVEEQSSEYASSKLKHLNNDPLPFVHERTGKLTRFTDFSDPKPRSKPTFSFYRPETLEEYIKKKPLRKRLLNIPELRADSYGTASFHMEIDDLDYTLFDALGGRSKMYQLFGDGMNMVINELNEALAA